jgi:hypothetical protein
MAKNKRYLYKIYDSAGNYIETLDNVVSLPEFSKTINSGLGEMKLTLAEKINEFDELGTILFNNILKVQCFDEDPDRILLHSCDAVAINGTWINYLDATNLATDDQIVHRGAGSLKFDIDVSLDPAENRGIIFNGTMAQVDLSDYESTGKVKLRIYFPITDFSNFTNVTLRWGADISNYWTKSVTVNDSGNGFQFGWNTLEFDWASASAVGSPDSSAIDSISVMLYYTAGQTDIPGVRLDWLEYEADSCKKGVQIYSGKLTRYNPVLQGTKEYVDVHFLSNMMELSEYVLEDADGNTTFTRSTEDPESMLQYVLDRFTTEGGTVDYTATSTYPVGATETYEFSNQSYFEAIEVIAEMCPTRWYWYVDSDDIVHLAPKGKGADHTFRLGEDIIEFSAEKNIEDVINMIYFTGGAQSIDDQTNETVNSTRDIGNVAYPVRCQQFLPTVNSISGITFQIDSIVGTYAGILSFSIQADNGSNVPDGAKLVEYMMTADDVNGADLNTDILIDLAADLTDIADGQKYWIVIESSTADGSNYIKVNTDSGGGYASGMHKSGLDLGSLGTSSHDMYFKTHYSEVLYKKYTRTSSVTNYGRKAIIEADERITDPDTMEALAQRKLDDNENPEIRMTMKIIDNNQSDFGYDIESIQPGQMIYVRNLVDTGFSKWDLGYWDEMYWDSSPSNIQERLMQIVSVTYHPDYAIITVSSRAPRVAETIEQINRDVKASKMLGNPKSPDSVTL